MDITYDSKSFIVNGKREWLFLAEIHYFRFPKEEWRKVIKMAKAAGVNTIATYLAWNYHETEEGKFDFSGDRSFADFIDIAKEEGMFVFVRPGPYICAEWSGGGIPSWILNYEELELRVDEETFMRCAENWYKEALRFIVPRLVTNGGNIIAVQNDNEYPGGWDEKSSSYIIKIYEMLKKYNVDVPITACNAHCKNGHLSVNGDADGNWEKIYKDIIVTYNTGGETSVIPELKAFQPEKPTLVTELWTGAQVYWKRPPIPFDNQSVNVCRFSALQTQVNLYMFAGGTNFEYNGACNIATSYSSTYPIGEGFNCTGQYYDIKLIGAFVKSFGGYIADCDYEELIPGELYSQKGESGELVYVTTDNPIYQYTHKGEKYTVTMGDRGFGIYPHKLNFNGKCIVSSDISLFNRKDNMLFFVGAAGEEKGIFVDNKEYKFIIKYHDVSIIDAEGIKLVICDDYMARRMWETEEGLLFGYDMAYDLDGSVYKKLDKDSLIVTIKDGRLTKEFRNKDKMPDKMPELKDWEINDALKEIEFTKINRPMSHNKLNVLHGYAWYRAKAKCEKEGYYMMMVSSFQNRILVYVNGKYFGAFGDGRNTPMRWDYENSADSVRDAVPVYLREGENEIIFLSEDTGYAFDDLKPMGILSDVYFDSRLVPVENPKYVGRTPISDTVMDYLYSKTVKDMENLNTLEFDLDLGSDEDVFFVAHAKPCFIFINGKEAKPVKQLKKPWQTYPHSVIWASFLSDGELKSKNKIQIQYYCKTDELLSELQMYVVKKTSKLYDWEYSAFNEEIKTEGRCDFESISAPASTLLVPAGETSAVINGFLPKYFTTHFKMPETEAVFLEIGKMKKGQIFLNGKNVGKFFGTHTQKLYYLPKAYMKEDNELTLFEEYGNLPVGVKIIG